MCQLDSVTPLSESELRMWLLKYRYSSKVFVLPPWKEIYVNDAERDHTLNMLSRSTGSRRNGTVDADIMSSRCRWFQLMRGVHSFSKHWQTTMPNLPSRRTTMDVLPQTHRLALNVNTREFTSTDYRLRRHWHASPFRLPRATMC